MATTSQSDYILQIGEFSLQQNELQMAVETPTSIFKLPDSVTQQNPESYSPSHVLLGPYHDLKPDLHKIQIFKLENALKLQHKFHLPEFSQMVDELNQIDAKIRSSYDRKFETQSSQALASNLLIDGLFLLQLLGISRDDQKQNSCYDRGFEISLPIFGEQQLHQNLELGNIVKTQNEVVKDLFMVENQIPVHVLRKIVPRNLSENFHLLFYKFCVSVSPLPVPPYGDNGHLDLEWFPDLVKVLENSEHLLHFLYCLIFYERLSGIPSGIPSGYQRSSSIHVDLLNLMATVVKVGILQQLVEAVGLIQSLVGLLLRVYKQSSSEEEEEEGSSLNLPSASDLRKVRVKFEPIISDEERCRFDEETATLKLPIITINAFSEVILRNLVAFESAAKLNPPFLSHYVMVMSGLIVTGKDVGVLKRCGIIAIVSGDDEDVVKLFKSLRNLLGVKFNDRKSNLEQSFFDLELRSIGEIKKYYESRWRIKAERFTKRWICPVFQALIIMIIVLLIVYVVIRTICGWFSCPKIFATTEGFINGGYYLSSF